MYKREGQILKRTILHFTDEEDQIIKDTIMSAIAEGRKIGPETEKLAEHPLFKGKRSSEAIWQRWSKIRIKEGLSVYGTVGRKSKGNSKSEVPNYSFMDPTSLQADDSGKYKTLELNNALSDEESLEMYKDLKKWFTTTKRNGDNILKENNDLKKEIDLLKFENRRLKEEQEKAVRTNKELLLMLQALKNLSEGKDRSYQQ